MTVGHPAFGGGALFLVWVCIGGVNPRDKAKTIYRNISDKMTINLIGVTKIDKSMSVTLQWCGNTRNTTAVKVAYSCATKKNTERNKISFNKPFESTFAILLTK